MPRCLFCGHKYPSEEIVAVTVGGTDEPYNSCLPCYDDRTRPEPFVDVTVQVQCPNCENWETRYSDDSQWHTCSVCDRVVYHVDARVQTTFK